MPRQWGSAAGLFRYHPLWTLEEILNAKAFIKPELRLTEDDLRDRFRHVGGVPRHIFSDPAVYGQAVDDQQSAIEELSLIPALAIASEWVLERKPLQPKSAVIGYEVDSQFEDYSMVIISSAARESIVAEYMKTLWNEMVTRREGGRWMLESYVRNLMIQGSREFQFRPCVGKNNTNYNTTQYVELGGCDSIELVVDIYSMTCMSSTTPNLPSNITPINIA